MKALEDYTPVHTFLVESGQMLVTDPCYEPGMWCTRELSVRAGWFDAYVIKGKQEQWGHRTAELLVHHKTLQFPHVPHLQWGLITPSEIGVDSGQCGFYDCSKWPEQGAGEYDDKASLYRTICDATLSENGGERNVAKLEHGVFSSSGFGDGGYPLYAGRDAVGAVMALRLVYIDDDEEEEGWD